MVKGIDESLKKVPCMTRKELNQVTKIVKDAVSRDVKTVEEISAENIRAKYASQLDAPIKLSRFGYELPKDIKMPPTMEELVHFYELPFERKFEILSDAIKHNAPKTKEEAFSRLEHMLQEIKRMNVEVPEEAVQQIRNDIIKKFGG